LWQFEIVKSRLEYFAVERLMSRRRHFGSALFWTRRLLPVRSAISIDHAENRQMRLSIFSIAVAALTVPLASANALPPVRAGILQCQGGQNVGFVVGSVTSLECVFQSEGRRPEPYLATVHRFGLDIGITDQTRLTWAVNAPTGRLGRGDLAGNYGGVGANASVVIGGGGNFLVGGPANAYALQPISVQGQTGLNVAAGVANIELEPAPFGRGGTFRHTHRHRHHG
jgi:hypothetical protein